MRKLFLVAVLVSFLSVPALSQEANWENLRVLKPGNKIKVVETALKSVEGKFVGVTDSDLTLEVNKQQVVVPRERVYRVSRKGRRRNALIGLLVGSGAGLGLGAAVLEREQGYAGAVAGTAVGFGGVGAAIGAAIPDERTIYRSNHTSNN